jgi:hypothetical protein
VVALPSGRGSVLESRFWNRIQDNGESHFRCWRLAEDIVVLLNIDIDRGAEIVDILDGAKLRPSVALWAHLSEYEDWRLVIAAREFDTVEIRAAYRLLNDSLKAGGMPPQNKPVVMILPMKDPFIKVLRRIFGKAKSVDGMRLGGQMIGDRFIEDAFVYRIS